MTDPSSGRGRRPGARGRDSDRDDPFAQLGLPTRPGLSDDDVRMAWRRVAAAAHPDREDGGDPVVFGAAAAAYAALRTEFGRGEALADLGLGASSGDGRPARRAAWQPAWHLVSLDWRPRGLAWQAAGAVAAGTAAVVTAGWSPGVVGVLAGLLTWLATAAGRARGRRRPR